MSSAFSTKNLVSRFQRAAKRSAWGAITVSLAIGWTTREYAFSKEKAAIAPVLTSSTINLGEIKLIDYSYNDKVVGKLGIYLNGTTPKSNDFVTGRLLLNPGETPHPPHTHPEEEVMVIEQGTGEISVDGKITKVGPGSVMYTTPMTPHGIVNTGKEPIVFYFMKWTAKPN